MPAWELLLLRMSITAVITYLAMNRIGVPHACLGPPGVRLLLLARGCLGFGFLGCDHTLRTPADWRSGLYHSLRVLSLPDATLLSFTGPVFAGISAYLLLGETLTVVEIAAGAVSMVGVILVAKPFGLLDAGDRADPRTPIDPMARLHATAIALASAACFGLAFRVRARDVD